MTKKHSSSWAEGWLQAQQQYLDALTALGRTAAGEDNNAPWQQALAQWQQFLSGITPEQMQGTFNNPFQEAGIFYAVAQQYSRLLQKLSADPGQQDNWQEVMDDYFRDLKAQIRKQFSHTGRQQQVSGNAWLSPLQAWLQILTAAPGLAGKELNSGLAEELLQFAKQYSSIPGLGYTREFQEQIQQHAHLWQQYETDGLAFREILAKIACAAVDELQKKIVKLAGDGTSINSLREFYDIWVDSHEQAYAGYAFTEEYARLYARLVNSLTAWKQQQRKMLDQLLSILNVPTAAAMDTLKKRQYKLQKQISAARSQLEQNDKQIQELKDTLEKLQRTISGRSNTKGKKQP